MKKLALFIVICYGKIGNTAPLDLANVDKIRVVNQISFLDDKNGEISFKEAITSLNRGSFKKFQRKSLNLGYNYKSIWLHIAFINSSSDELSRYFLIGSPALDIVELYDLSEPTFPSVSGDILSKSERFYPELNHVFPMVFKPNQSKDFLVRISTTGAMTLPIDIVSEKAYIEAQELDRLKKV